MMFTTLSAKLAGKVKVLAATAVAGAALMLASPAAQAQHVVFGVRLGAPAYVAPAPPVVFAGPGYYGGYYVRDYDAWRARFAWDHRFDRHDFDRRDFDRHDFDRGRHFDRR